MLEVSSLPGPLAVLIIVIRIVVWVMQRVDGLNDLTLRPIPVAKWNYAFLPKDQAHVLLLSPAL